MELCFTSRTKASKPFEGLREQHPYVCISYDEFAYLRPAFEAIKLKTDKLVDYYDWAEFQDAELDLFSDELKKAKNELASESSEISFKEPENDVIRVVSTDEMRSVFQQILSIVANAKENDRILICKGP